MPGRCFAAEARATGASAVARVPADPARTRAAGARRVTARTSGLGLVEVLVALLVLSIGLFGAVGAQRSAIHGERRSTLHTVAVERAHELIARVRANPAGAGAGGYLLVQPYAEIDTTAPTLDCGGSSPSCSPLELAQADITAWNRFNAALLPGGRGALAGDAGALVVTVMWREGSLAPAATAAADPGCSAKNPPEELPGLRCLNIAFVP